MESSDEEIESRNKWSEIARKYSVSTHTFVYY